MLVRCCDNFAEDMESSVRWLCPMVLLRLMATLMLFSFGHVDGQHWNDPVAHAPPQFPSNSWNNGFPANVWNNGFPGGGVASGVVTLQQDRLMAQQLPGGQRRLYQISVPKGGSVGITVHPRRGSITWNITHDNVYMMVHPFYTHVLRAPLPVYEGPGSSRFKRSVRGRASGAKSRVVRQLYSGAVRSNFDFDVTELNAGYGRSMGAGSINYIKEDMGGVYTMDVANMRMNDLASFYIYATLQPANSPYPRVPGDPQARAARLESHALNLEWQPVRQEFEHRTEYCVFYHSANNHQHSDVHSSPYADHLQRSSTVRERCNRRPFARISRLRPQTEYHIDVMARDLMTRRMSTYIGVKAATLSTFQQRQQVQHEQQHGQGPGFPGNHLPDNMNHGRTVGMGGDVAQGPGVMAGADLVNPDLLQPNLDFLPPADHPEEEILDPGRVDEENLLPNDGAGQEDGRSSASPAVRTNTLLVSLLLALVLLNHSIA